MTRSLKVYFTILVFCYFLLPNKLYAFPFQNDYNNTQKDTTKDWKTIPPLPFDIADSIANKLLTENPIFLEDWSNAAVFVYNVPYANLPDKIEIPLLDSEDKFQLTWYGKLNSKYGPRWGRMHKGMDLFLRTGDTVVAAFNGVVRYADYNSGGFGNCVVVRHTNGLETVYGHLSEILVDENQYVQAGEVIGLGGTTGHSTGPHLHFETRYKDFSIDPELYYNTETGTLLLTNLVLGKEKLKPIVYPKGTRKKHKRSKKSKHKKKTKKGSSSKAKSNKKTSKKASSSKAKSNKKTSKKGSSSKAKSSKKTTKKASSSKSSAKKGKSKKKK
jgi:hypothetical protein